MFINWNVYPVGGQVLDEYYSQLPYPPNERFASYVSYLSPTWDVDLQQYVDEYVNRFVGWRTQFNEAFNGHCSHNIEVHGAADYCFSNRWLREFINLDGKITLYSS